MDRGRESQGSTTACSNLSERDGKDQGEGSPKQTCSYWFARSSLLATVARTSWLAIVGRTSILSGTWPMLYCVSLALSVSRLDFVIWFCFVFCFLFVAPYVLVCCRWISLFPSIYDIDGLCYYCCLSCFRMVFTCDHELDFWDQLMWKFNKKSINQYRNKVTTRQESRFYRSKHSGYRYVFRSTISFQYTAINYALFSFYIFLSFFAFLLVCFVQRFSFTLRFRHRRHYGFPNVFFLCGIFFRHLALLELIFPRRRESRIQIQPTLPAFMKNLHNRKQANFTHPKPTMLTQCSTEVVHHFLSFSYGQTKRPTSRK